MGFILFLKGKSDESDDELFYDTTKSSNIDAEEDETPVDDDSPKEESCSEESSDFVPAELKVHLGKNLFATAKKQYGSVDLRHYFFTNKSLKSLHPTRKGVNLSFQEFTNVMKQIPALENKWAGLKVLSECSYSHHSEIQQLKCNHCTPTPTNNDKESAAKAARQEDLDETVVGKPQPKVVLTKGAATTSGDKRKHAIDVGDSSDDSGSSTEEQQPAVSPLLINDEWDLQTSGLTPKKNKLSMLKKKNTK